MADQKYFYQDGYSEQEEKKLKRYEVWAQKTLEDVKEGVADGSLNEEQYGAFSIEFWKDESLVWACLEAEHDIERVFSHVRKFLWRDKEFVLGAMSERWYYPMTSIEFQDQEFNYFDFIHESLSGDEDIDSALNKLKSLETS